MSNKHHNSYDTGLNTRLEIVATTTPGAGNISSITNTTTKNGGKQVCNNKEHKHGKHHKHDKKGHGECDGTCGGRH